MNYKKLLIIFLFLLNSCNVNNTVLVKKDKLDKKPFVSSGFAMIFDEKLYKNKIIGSKLDDRGLIVFQRNLTKGSILKITNINNNKSIIATVGKKTKYPIFNKLVISKRIADVLEIDVNEPYVELKEIVNKSTFIAKKVKTFDEEKKVAGKAPVDSISVNDLNETITNKKKSKNKNFSYIIKIADFYFEDTAKLLVSRIKNETPVKKVNIKSLSKTNYRVFLGPFHNLISLKKSFNDISLLDFENIQIIKND